jgi:hypothetical protein
VLESGTRNIPGFLLITGARSASKYKQELEATQGFHAAAQPVEGRPVARLDMEVMEKLVGVRASVDEGFEHVSRR